MIKVLVVAKDLQLHGISTVIMNYFQFLAEDFSMSFAVGKPIDEMYRNIIASKGGRLFELPGKSEDPIDYYRKLNEVMSKEKFDIIHIHGNSATILVELFLGILHKIPVRIAHSHNCTCNHKIVHKVLKGAMSFLYTDAYACSLLAGKWMFGKRHFEVIQNCFDTKSFVYNSESRELYRKKMNAKNSLIVGHVGFFNEQKNQRFIVDVFREFIKFRADAILLFVGDGYTRKDIQEYVNGQNLSDKVIFWGASNDVSGLMSAMDLFLFPSLYEGLGIVLLEAQISGLPCLLSDVIPNETKLGEEYYKLSLEDSALKWAERLVDISRNTLNRSSFYETYKDVISDYDCSSVANRLYDLYCESYLKVSEK